MSSSQAEPRAALSPPLSPLFHAHAGAFPSPKARTTANHSNGTVNAYQPMGNVAMHRNMSSQSLERPAALAVPSGAKPNRLSLVDPFGVDLVTTNHSPYDFARRSSTTPTSPNLSIPNSRRNSGILPVAMRNQSSSSVNTFSSASPDRSRVLPRSKLSTQTDFSSPSFLEDSYKYAPTPEDFKNTSLYKRTMKAKKKLEEQGTALPKSVSSPALDKTAAQNRRSSLFMMHNNPSTSTLNTLDSGKTTNRKSRRLSTFWSFKSSPDLRVESNPAAINSPEMTPAPSAAESAAYDTGPAETLVSAEPASQLSQLAAPPHTLHKRLSIVHEARPSMESESLSPFSSPSRLRHIKTIERLPKPLERPPPVIAVSTVSQTLTSASSLSPTFSSGSLNSASSSSSLPPQREAEAKAGDPTRPSDGVRNAEASGVNGNRPATVVAAGAAGTAGTAGATAAVVSAAHSDATQTAKATAAQNETSPILHSAENIDGALPDFPGGAPETSESQSMVTDAAGLNAAQSTDARLPSDSSYGNNTSVYGDNSAAYGHNTSYGINSAAHGNTAAYGNYSGVDRSGLQHSNSADTSTPLSPENATPHPISPETSQDTFYRAPGVLPYDGSAAPVSKQYSEVRQNLTIVRNAPRRHSSLQASVVGSESASSSPALSQVSFAATQEQGLRLSHSREGATTPASHTSVHSAHSVGLSAAAAISSPARAKGDGSVSELDARRFEGDRHASGLKGARPFVSENVPETGAYTSEAQVSTAPNPTETLGDIVPRMYNPAENGGRFSAAPTTLTAPSTENNRGGISHSASTQTTNSMFDSSPVKGRTGIPPQSTEQHATLMASPTRLRAITPPRTSSEQAKSLLAGVTMGGLGSHNGGYGTAQREVAPSQGPDPVSSGVSDPAPPLSSLSPDSSNEATPTRPTTQTPHHAHQPSLTSLASSSSLAQSRSSYVSARGESSRLSHSSTIGAGATPANAAPRVTPTTAPAGISPTDAPTGYRDISYPSIKPVQVRQTSGELHPVVASPGPSLPSSIASPSSSKPLPPIGVASARTTRGFGLFKGGKSKVPEATRNVSASSKASSKASDSTVTSKKRGGFFGFKFGAVGRKSSADSTASSLPGRSGGTVIADVRNPTGSAAGNGAAKQLNPRRSQQFGQAPQAAATAPHPLDKRSSQQFHPSNRNSQQLEQQTNATARQLAQRHSQQFAQKHTTQPPVSRQQSQDYLRQQQSQGQVSRQQSHDSLRQQQGRGVYQPQLQVRPSPYAPQQRQSPVEARYGAQGPRPLPPRQPQRQSSFDHRPVQAQRQNSYEQQGQSMLGAIPEQRRQSQQLPFDQQQIYFHSQPRDQQRQSFQEQPKRYSHQYQSNGAQSRTGGTTASPHTHRSRTADSADPNTPSKPAKQSRGFLASLKNASSQSENYYSRTT